MRRSVVGRPDLAAVPKPLRVRIGDSPYAVVSQGDLNIVMRGTVVLYHFRTDDRVGRYVAAVDLVLLHEVGLAAVARGLGLPRRSVYRVLARFQAAGVDGLAGGKGCRKPTKIRDAEARQLLVLKRQGASHREAARRLGVSPSGVAEALQRLGWKPDRNDEEPASSGARADASGQVPVTLAPAADSPASESEGENAVDVSRPEHREEVEATRAIAVLEASGSRSAELDHAERAALVDAASAEGLDAPGITPQCHFPTRLLERRPYTASVGA